jgi:hypothetical protein
MSSHCFGFAKLHLHMPFQQSSYGCCSSKLQTLEWNEASIFIPWGEQCQAKPTQNWED